MWAPHPVDGYQLGQIVDVGADTLTVEPLASSEQVGSMDCWVQVVSLPVYYSTSYLATYRAMISCGLLAVWGTCHSVLPWVYRQEEIRY